MRLHRPHLRTYHRTLLRRIVAAAWFAPLSALASQQVVTQGADARGADAPPIRREFRGAWVASVANIDWPSKPGLSAFEQQAELLALLDRARALKLNAILLQVRPAADALYDSPYEPWSAYLTGVEGRAPEPYYDPLTFAVREAHARGLELHAWFNPYRARHPTATGAHARTHVSVKHPTWVRSYGQYEWMDPGDPAVLAHTLRVIIDVVRRYDVDGIHVDDYFYPYPESRDSVEVPFPDSSTYAAHQRAGGTLSLSDWRRDNVDRFVEQLYRRTKAVKPWVKVGISPFGIWRPGYPAQIKGFDAYEKLAGDAKKWINEGWVDYFTPQLYWPIAQEAQSYPVLLDWWLGENTKQRHIWPGHNSSRAAQAAPGWGPDELNEQVRATRATAATGDIFFSMRSLVPTSRTAPSSASAGVATLSAVPDAPLTIGDRLATELYAEPALVPASPWLGRTPPAAPRAQVVRDPVSDEDVLVMQPGPRARWITVRLQRGGAWTVWVLPASHTRTVVGTREIAPTERLVITVVDRNGNESRPTTIVPNLKTR
jgi:uncharacterized lipoprotein YddW (UPF0748 family)